MDGGTRKTEDRADPWRDFLAPEDTRAFLNGWLLITAGRTRGATGAVLFLRGDAGRMGTAATWQIDGDDALAPAVTLTEALMRDPQPLFRQQDGRTWLGYPLDTGGEVQGVLVLALDHAPQGAAIQTLMRELHWAAGWIEARLWQGKATLGRKQADSARTVLRLMSAAGEHDRFDGAALALVNAVPELTGFDGAALGMVRGQRLRLEALSRTAHFARKSDRARAYEAAMEETRAQAEAVAWPDRPDGRRMIDAAHGILARDLGAGALVSVPLTDRGQIVGVLMLEHTARGDGQHPVLAADALDDLRLIAAALAPLIRAKYRERRLVSGRLRDWVGRGVTALAGRRPAIALGGMAAAALLALLVLLPAELRIRADATLLGAVQQAAVAPVDGFIADAPIRAGQEVSAGTVLARLDDRELALRAAAEGAQLAQARQALREAMAQGDRAAASVANADVAEAQAAADLTAAQRARLTLTAPITGLVVSGDLSQRLGAPVQQGEILFEIAQQDGWRLQIDVSEFDLAPVAVGQTGTVVFSGLSGTEVGLTVTAIASVSDPGEGENRFRVEAALTAPPDTLRPGLQGVAKIDTGPSRLGWVLIRGTVNRLRVLLWRFTP